MSFPLNITEPDVSRKPKTVFSAVLLPAPLGPISDTISLSFTLNDTSLNTLFLPYPLETFLTDRRDIRNIYLEQLNVFKRTVCYTAHHEFMHRIAVLIYGKCSAGTFIILDRIEIHFDAFQIIFAFTHRICE